MVYRMNLTPMLEEYGKDLRLSPSGILKMLENAGTRHSAAVGDSLGECLARGEAWFLTDWYVEIYTRIPMGLEVRVETFWRKSERTAALLREFRMRDEEGNLIALVVGQCNLRLLVHDIPHGFNHEPMELLIKRLFEMRFCEFTETSAIQSGNDIGICRELALASIFNAAHLLLKRLNLEQYNTVLVASGTGFADALRDIGIIRLHIPGSSHISYLITGTVPPGNKPGK
jgi:hypothetical protein